MRKLEYLSPTSLSLYLQDNRAFYMRYLADKRPPRDPQTAPMAVGSSFDAYVKSYLHGKIYGEGHDPRFKFESIFETQVENQNRDEALKAGKYVFEEYKKSGCLTDLMAELSNSVTDPRFEFDLMGRIDGKRENIGIVPFLGKPDLYFTNKAGARVIHDWKVNGYYSNYNTSPLKGYVRLREYGQNKGCHKECMSQVWNGILINVALFLETVKEDWAQQLAIYSWLCGEDVGTELCIASVDQVVCKASTVRPLPDLRFAEHRLRISKQFQYQVFDKAQEAWETINSDHYFRNLDKEVSQQRCLDMDNLYADQPDQTTEDVWHKRVCREF